MELVQSDHPVARQAELQLGMGESSVLAARGGFDPKGVLDISQKYDDGTQYYSLAKGGLKIPTWFGVELQTMYEQNQGTYLNPENLTTGRGLWLAGVSVPIGKGLFIDERRAMLRQAQIYQQSTLAERQLILNDLLLDAGKAYWDWFKAYNALLVYQDALDLAVVRFEAVKQAAFLGDRPFIDTLEAGIQVQTRQMNLGRAELDFINQSGLVSVYLWEDGLVPLEMAQNTRPLFFDSVANQGVDPLLLMQRDSLLNQHPAIQQGRFKLDRLDIDRRLKAEQLKPQLDLNYNAINTPIAGDPWADYSINNYKWGLNFSMPIFLRKERGALQFTRFKIEEAQYDLSNKTAMLAYKAQAYLNVWDTSRDLFVLYSRTVRDLGSLLDGERQLFSGGESSLFMINAREISFISARVQLVELLVENQKANLSARYILGILGNL